MRPRASTLHQELTWYQISPSRRNRHLAKMFLAIHCIHSSGWGNLLYNALSFTRTVVSLHLNKNAKSLRDVRDGASRLVYVNLPLTHEQVFLIRSKVRENSMPGLKEGMPKLVYVTVQ
jgi:hypothetical protein